MKTLIKIIIALFLTALMLLYILIPCIRLGYEIVSWHIDWLIISHIFVGTAIMIVPIIYIYNWIDKNIE